MKPRYKRHRYALWPDLAETWIYAHITMPGRTGEPYDVLEQIPAQHVGCGNYRICSAPITIHGFALGDVVQTKPYGRMNYIDGMIEHNGHYTLYVFYTKQVKLDARSLIEDQLLNIECLIDRWDEMRYAIDAPSQTVADAAYNILLEFEARGELVFGTCWDAPEYGRIERRATEDWPIEIVMHKAALDVSNSQILTEVLAPKTVDFAGPIQGVCWEQLCLSRISEDFVRIECIPFRFWDLNFGDVVHICANEHGHQILKHIESRSGNKTIRIELNRETFENSRPALLDILNEYNGQVEFEEDNIKCAASIPGQFEAEQFVNYLERKFTDLDLNSFEKTWN